MDAFAGRVQMVFQDPYVSLNPCLTVREALEEALRAAGTRAVLSPETAEHAGHPESRSAHRNREKGRMERKKSTGCSA